MVTLSWLCRRCLFHALCTSCTPLARCPLSTPVAFRLLQSTSSQFRPKALPPDGVHQNGCNGFGVYAMNPPELLPGRRVNPLTFLDIPPSPFLPFRVLISRGVSLPHTPRCVAPSLYTPSQCRRLHRRTLPAQYARQTDFPTRPLRRTSAYDAASSLAFLLTTAYEDETPRLAACTPIVYPRCQPTRFYFSIFTEHFVEPPTPPSLIPTHFLCAMSYLRHVCVSPHASPIGRDLIIFPLLRGPGR
ncbi:hypothetical protein K438DRAFT_1163636 [Mycena galopus ATCC 62051]|nr:hypothetical protein K438DRAFT_1163636 [Mycena galopus ATCC 62051]